MYLSHQKYNVMVFITISPILDISKNLEWAFGFPGSSKGKESARNTGDLCSIPGSGRSPGEGNDNPLQYSCLESSMDRGSWQVCIVDGVAKRHEQVTNLHFFFLDTLLQIHLVAQRVNRLRAMWETGV